MKWENQAIVIDLQSYSSELLIISVLTVDYGLRKGLIKSSKKNKTALGIGNILIVQWHARLDHHLGTFKVHEYEAIAPFFYYDKKKIKLMDIYNTLDEIHGIPYAGQWLHVGTPSAVNHANSFIKKNK